MHFNKIIAILLLFTSILFSQFNGYLEVGKDVESDVSYTDIKLEYKFNYNNLFIKPFGGQMTWFEYGQYNKNYPFRDVYYIGIESGYKNITFGIDHYCSHAVYSRNNWHKYNEPVHNSQLTKIYARYNFR